MAKIEQEVSRDPLIMLQHWLICTLRFVIRENKHCKLSEKIVVLRAGPQISNTALQAGHISRRRYLLGI